MLKRIDAKDAKLWRYNRPFGDGTQLESWAQYARRLWKFHIRYAPYRLGMVLGIRYLRIGGKYEEMGWCLPWSAHGQATFAHVQGWCDMYRRSRWQFLWRMQFAFEWRRVPKISRIDYFNG